MDTLGDAFPREVERVRELAGMYRSIPTGVFALKMFIEPLLKQAEEAMRQADTVAMIRLLPQLKELE